MAVLRDISFTVITHSSARSMVYAIYAAATVFACSGASDNINIALPDAAEGGAPMVDAEAIAMDAAMTPVLTISTTNSNGGAGIISSDVGGIACGSTCSGSIALGSPVVLTATPDSRSFFAGWTGGVCQGTSTCTVTLTASTIVSATFKSLSYGQSTTTLYKVNPDTGEITEVNPFTGDCAGKSMGDIAIDQTHAMFGISDEVNSTLYKIDQQTAVCTAVGSLGTRCNGLSFAPDPASTAKDKLYAGCGLQLWSINTTTGAATTIGDFGNGYTCSGDIIGIRGLGNFATLTNGATYDVLASIDLTTGVATVIGTDLGFAQVWALGLASGKLLGWTSAQQLLLIDPVVGLGRQLDANVGFVAYGGASNTLAP